MCLFLLQLKEFYMRDLSTNKAELHMIVLKEV